MVYVLFALYLFSVALASSRILTGVDCEIEISDTVRPPWTKILHGYAEERTNEGKIFQFVCDDDGCWNKEEVEGHGWLACGYSWLTTSDLDRMLDAVLIADNDKLFCEKCPYGKGCDRNSEGECIIYDNDKYHCLVGTIDDVCPSQYNCWMSDDNQYYSWNTGSANLETDYCYDLSAGIWHTIRQDEQTVDADCPNRDCADVDSITECKKWCEQYDDCLLVNFQKMGDSYRCCLRELGCDYSTALSNDAWDILERSNVMPRVITDVITVAWESHEDFAPSHCGEDNPGFERVAHWDATPHNVASIDSSGTGGRHYMVLCVRYDSWQRARSRSYVTDLFVSDQETSEGAIWIGKTNVEDKNTDFRYPWSHHDNKQVDKWMNFFITKGAGTPGYSSADSSPIHYVPGIPVGGWSILYSGNGAGDSHTFTSILTSTDETSNHQERIEAFTSSSSWETTATFGYSFTYGTSKEAKPTATFSQTEYSMSAHWTHNEETTEEISKTVANTLTSSLENGEEVSCVFQAPDIGGALYNTWVWKTARVTYAGEVTELQTCHTHVKVGPCRDQPPNCVPGYCKDQDCQDCLDEAAKIDTEFSLRPECADETSGQDNTMDCHASNFNVDTNWQCCTSANPCGQDEGDCDTNEDCIGDLVCVQDAGAGYGVSQYVDVCMLSRKDNGRRLLTLEEAKK